MGAVLLLLLCVSDLDEEIVYIFISALKSDTYSLVERLLKPL